MKRYSLYEEEYKTLLKNVKLDVDIEDLEVVILKLLNLQSVKDQTAILDYLIPDRTQIYDIYHGKLEPAISYCIKNGWVKKISQADILFEKQFYGEDIINTYVMYKIGNLGLSAIGAKLYNEIELKIDEIYNRRPYEEDIEKIIQTDKILLVSHYKDLLEKQIQKMVNNFYSINKRRGIELEINYTEVRKINHWVVRRYTILEPAYMIEISYKIIKQIHGSFIYFGQ